LFAAERNVERVRPHAEFRRVGLADRDHASGAHPRDEQRVLDRHEILVDRRAARVWEAHRRLEVLEGRRQTMQRRQRLAARGTPIGLVGEREAPLVVELRDDRVQLRVQPRDPLEVRRHDLARRHGAVLDQRSELGRAREAKIVGRPRRGAGPNGRRRTRRALRVRRGCSGLLARAAARERAEHRACACEGNARACERNELAPIVRRRHSASPVPAALETSARRARRRARTMP
jgi:hypothetical protein